GSHETGERRAHSHEHKDAEGHSTHIDAGAYGRARVPANRSHVPAERQTVKCDPYDAEYENRNYRGARNEADVAGDQSVQRTAMDRNRTAMCDHELRSEDHRQRR